MQRTLSSAVLALLGAVSIAILHEIVTAQAAAQQSSIQSATPANTAPRSSWDGKPDFTGVWEGASLTPREYGLADLERLYRPAAGAEMKKLSDKDDPVNQCIPYGFPRHVATPYPIQIVKAVGAILVLMDHPHIYRYIPTTGRPHTPAIFPTYLGDSTGQWEGDTLVVDIAAFNGKTWLAGAKDHPTLATTGGWTTSDALHIVERWRLSDSNTLQYQATVQDPKTLTAAWTTPKISLKRASIRKIGEGHCIPAHVDYEAPALN